MEPPAKSLIRDLLHPDADLRLGCRGTRTSLRMKSGRSGAAMSDLTGGGWSDVRRHEFFKGMDWEALMRREIATPLKPESCGKSMVGNFAREYTRQRVQWGGDQQELRDVADREGLFRRELLGFDFVRHH